MGTLRSMSRFVTGLICFFLSAFTTHIASADSSFDHQFFAFMSSTGNILFLAAGTGLPLVEDGKAGRNHTLRALDALTTSELLSYGLKSLTREKRPDTFEHDSLPSSHAVTSFAVATVESDLHPKQAIYWYAGATLISASRFALHRHTVGDVLFGAAMGYGIGRLEMSSKRGLLLSPWIQPEKHAVGLSFRSSF